IAMDLDRHSQRGGTKDPFELFRVAAHEYSHFINTQRYHLGNEWLREGHSEWAASRVITQTLGAHLAEWRLRNQARNFLEDELNYGVVSLEVWPAPDRSLSYDYAKAETLLQLLSAQLSERSLDSVWSNTANCSPPPGRDPVTGGIVYCGGT